MESNKQPLEATQLEEPPFSMEVLPWNTKPGDTLVIDMGPGTPQSVIMNRCKATGKVTILIHNACEGDEISIFHGMYNELYQPLHTREKEDCPVKYRNVGTHFRVQGRC